MEKSSHVDNDNDMSYQIVARLFSEKVTNFGGICFNIKKKHYIQIFVRADHPRFE